MWAVWDDSHPDQQANYDDEQQNDKELSCAGQRPDTL
jgi:hypothetical protein